VRRCGDASRRERLADRERRRDRHQHGRLVRIVDRQRQVEGDDPCPRAARGCESSVGRRPHRDGSEGLVRSERGWDIRVRVQDQFDLTTLSSDERDRDNFVKRDTLQANQFPTAEFVPTKATGLTLPLPASGTFTFTLTGNLTIKGTTKEVTFDVTAKRDGSDLTATATANPSWKFGDFGMRAPSVPFRVLSVTDEIRAVIDLVATGPRD
jgi:polyisoprenoid-binding protein YceI